VIDDDGVAGVGVGDGVGDGVGVGSGVGDGDGVGDWVGDGDGVGDGESGDDEEQPPQAIANITIAETAARRNDNI
jgi:hypothetical protein